VEPKKAVRAPMKLTKKSAYDACSKMYEHRIVKKTPAVTIVAAWIKADTGVGPSIASGSHVCNPNWADFPTTPKNKKNEIISDKKNSYPKITTQSCKIYGAKANTVKKSTVPKNKKIKNIPKAKPQSPTRLTTIALRADLFAWIRVYQKLISKYDESPTPSQPRNIWIKFPAVNSIAIKNVKNDKYDMNRIRCGSSDMYSSEYRWTKLETKNTTNSIVEDNESNKNTHSTFKISTDSQLIGKITKQLDLSKVTSTKIKKEQQKLKIIQIRDITAAPARAINLPNKSKANEEKNGTKISNKYINKKN
jgi:hypothetical protein